MSTANTSPLTDDRASFEHGRAAGQQAAQQLSATSPLSPRQLAWLNGFLEGLVNGAKTPTGAFRLPEPSLSEPPRVEPLRVDGPRPDGSGQSAASDSDFFPNLRPDPDLERARGGMGARAPAPQVDPAFLRMTSPPFVAAATELALELPAGENAGAAVNPTDLAVHVRASLVTSSKRGTNLAEDGRSKYSSDNPFAARIVQIVANQARNPSAWRVTLDVESSGLRCRPGDVLGVVPSNDPDLVRRLLRRLNAKGQETVTTARGTGPAWRALLEEFSITQVTKELLWVLAASTRNANEARQLETLANSATNGNDSSLATILRRFPSARPSLNDFANSLCPLVPQYYPLASARSRQAETLEILAARHANDPRSVVHQLHQEKLAQGDWLPVFVDAKPHVHPPTDISAPVILLAPGVGAACAFAFLAERAATRGSGRNWLFTSPIDGETEVAYAEHFAAWQTSRTIGRLDVSPTQQLGKRLIDHGEMVQAWVVDGSYMYIHGTKSDCYELEQALAQLLVMRARITQEEAHKRLDAMRTSGQLRVNTVS